MPLHTTEISHFFHHTVCIDAGPDLLACWKVGTNPWWEFSLLRTVRNYKNCHPLICPLRVSRIYLISAVDDRKPNSNDLVPKGNLLALVNRKLTGVELTSDIAWCYKDTLLTQPSSLLCTSFLLTQLFFYVSMTNNSNLDFLFSTTCPGGKNEKPSSRISRKASLVLNSSK